jgi:hypothetical protein
VRPSHTAERLAAQSPAHKPGFNANLPEYLIVQLMPSSVAPTKTRRLAPTKSSNTHRAPHPARGFVPRRLSDAYRRPKLFTKTEWQIPGDRTVEADIRSCIASWDLSI